MQRHFVPTLAANTSAPRQANKSMGRYVHICVCTTDTPHHVYADKASDYSSLPQPLMATDIVDGASPAAAIAASTWIFIERPWTRSIFKGFSFCEVEGMRDIYSMHSNAIARVFVLHVWNISSGTKDYLAMYRHTNAKLSSYYCSTILLCRVLIQKSHRLG